MKLRDWIAQEGLTYDAAAKSLGLANATMARRYALGIRIPRRPNMAQITAATGGQVTADDFYADCSEPVEERA